MLITITKSEIAWCIYNTKNKQFYNVNGNENNLWVSAENATLYQLVPTPDNSVLPPDCKYVKMIINTQKLYNMEE